MAETQFPAVIIISRGPTAVHDDVFVCADDRACQNEKELQSRLSVLDAWAAAYRTPYTHTPTPAAEVGAVIARLRAELEQAHGLASEEPAPVADYLGEAYEAAKKAFAGDRGQLARLDRALALVKAGKVFDKGGGKWWVKADSSGVWTVNGSGCNCPDSTYRGRRWCKHALAVALVRKAKQIEEGQGAATPKALEGSEETPTHPQDTTPAAPRQVELIVTYEADQARERPRMAGGELEAYKVDGQPATPPTRDLSELYRWLQANGYTPADFSWLGRAIMGKRQRRQVYALATS